MRFALLWTLIEPQASDSTYVPLAFAVPVSTIGLIVVVPQHDFHPVEVVELDMLAVRRQEELKLQTSEKQTETRWHAYRTFPNSLPSPRTS
jgi:hypothetical protein